MGPPKAAFPPVFVINLRRSTERRSIMTGRLNQLGVDHSVFEAVDGQKLELETASVYDGARRRMLFGRDMTKGELGCLLSHRAIYQAIVDRDIEKAVILEDDTILSTDFPDVVRALIELPVVWDMVRFLDNEKIYKKCRDIGPLCGAYTLIRPATTSGGGHAYLVTQNGARHLLRHTRQNYLPIDILHSYVWRTGLEIFAVKPSPAVRDMVIESTMEGTRFIKQLQISGWWKAIYPATRLWLRLSEWAGKRSSYWLSWPADLRNRRRLNIRYRQFETR